MRQVPADRPFSAFRVFAAPVALMAVSAIGLVAALIGDGMWDVLSWLGLAAPLAAIGWYVARRPPSTSPPAGTGQE